LASIRQFTLEGLILGSKIGFLIENNGTVFSILDMAEKLLLDK